MRSLRCSKVFWSSGLVKISAQLRADGTFVIVQAPDLIWLRKWCHFTVRCFVRGRYPSVVARTMQPALSSKISDGLILGCCSDCNSRLEYVLDLSSRQIWSGDTKVFLCISCMSCLIGSKLRMSVLRAMYSASVVLKAISVCNFEVHTIGQFAYFMIEHALDNTDEDFSLHAKHLQAPAHIWSHVQPIHGLFPSCLGSSG